MGIWKKILVALLALLLLGAVVLGLKWHSETYTMVGLHFYPKDAAMLDLRGQEISVGHYTKLSRRLPGCDILWDVPLSGGRFDDSIRVLTITELTDRDVELTDYLTELETVEAEGCEDYVQLMALQQRRPEVEVRYSVPLAGERYDCRIARISLTDFREEELEKLQYLPRLQSVICGGGEREGILALQSYCHENGLEFFLMAGDKAVPDTETQVTLTGATEADLALLAFVPGLERLELEAPEIPAEVLLAFQEAHPGVDMTWDARVCGELYSTETEELDLSGESIRDLAELQQELAYLPRLETVFLGECGLDNEELAAFREEVREQYKVVWTVKLGEKLKARTDDTTFMPTRERVYYFKDEEAYNLRYCEDMVCIDIGHMSISNIDFVEFMPDLEYLILAHTQVQYIEPIRHCEKLKFLELDWAPVKDLAPLEDCTALEDLNLGNTFADFEPIGRMTWLKNLWMIGCSSGARYRMTNALPDTKVMISGSATVANGWRDLPNYYKMRDLLGMEYMSW
ncbi:MAG: hypothetical protein IKJ84_03250 [Oscillospiraceae bacterium]|nr:hypothetical protein [Oscillospiraceae bacterium]MBR6595202.1 hypothetical protein [Oscillospiraceae bacterium]